MIKLEQPKLYIVSPAEFEIDTFAEQLKPILDTVEVSCFRLALSTQDEKIIGKSADLVRHICHSRDVAVVIENHFLLVQKYGLDGVHLSDGSRNVGKARKNLGKDTIIGAFCGSSKHDGLIAGESKSSCKSSKSASSPSPAPIVMGGCCASCKIPSMYGVEFELLYQPTLSSA